MEFFHLLRTRSTHWDEIGRELGICLTYRVSLRSSITSGSLSDNNCLESILQQWVKQSNDPNTMWKHFEEAMMRLQYNDVLEMMKTSHAESASYVTHDTMKVKIAILIYVNIVCTILIYMHAGTCLATSY